VKILRVTLYVKGVKVAKMDDRSRIGYASRLPPSYPWWGGSIDVTPDYKVYREVEYKSVLPDDQKKVVEMVQAMALKHGFEVNIIDVTKENLLHRLEEKIKKINTFPTLVTDTGEKIEGRITEEKIKSLLSKNA